MREDVMLRKIRAGDPSGLEELMNRYIPYVSAIVWNLLRAILALELKQEEKEEWEEDKEEREEAHHE